MDKATLPENGIIYEGDYYKQIPFFEYIKKMEIPKNNIYDIRDFGAIGDGITVCTKEIQRALDMAKGGGTVLITGGHYISGTLRVLSNTTVFIDVDSAIVASKNHDNFSEAFIIFDNSNNSCLTGGGKIIGNGEYFTYLPLRKPRLTPLEKVKLPPVLYDPMGYPVDTMRYEIRSRIRYAEDKYGEGLPKIKRPMYMVWLYGCVDVKIYNIILESAMDWNLCIDNSKRVHVKDIVINGNRHVANADGIDVMGSSDITVKHCFISCADDGLCVKSPRNHTHDGLSLDFEKDMGATERILFEDCTVLTVANCFKIGTETYYDISDVTVRNCKFMLPDIFPGACSGISIESADGAHIRNIAVKNIEMSDISCPIFICLNKRNKFGYSDKKDLKIRILGGSIENVVIKNIRAKGALVPSILTGFAISREKLLEEYVGILNENDMKITDEIPDNIGAGLNIRLFDGSYINSISNISISDMFISYRQCDEEINLLDKVTQNIYDYPENSAFGDVPACGMYIRHGRNVELKNFSVIPRKQNIRECVVREDAY